jgi:hypothetical protein
MAWNAHPTLATGSTFTAAAQNTYVKGNLDTLFPYTAANQIAYSGSSTTLTTINLGAALSVLRANSTNSALEFGKVKVIYRRQGYSATNWATTPTSTSTAGTLANYTPTNSIIQAGATRGQTITFPVPFLYAPIVFVFQADYGVAYTNAIGNLTSSSTAVGISELDAFGMLYWIAIGEIST